MKISKHDEELRSRRQHAPNTWDPSMVHSLLECSRLFYFTYIRNIGPPHEPDYFVSGRAWDAAMGEMERPTGTLDERYFKAIDAINKVYDNTTCIYFDPARTRENLYILLEKWLELNAVLPYTVIESNLPLRVKIEDDLYLGGELDKYMQWDPYGLVIGETKTSKEHSGTKKWDNYVQQFSLGSYANQITHYNIVVERAIGKTPWGTCVFTTCLDIPKRKTTQRQLFNKIWVEHSESRKAEWLKAVKFASWKCQYNWDTWEWPMEGQKCTGPWGFIPCGYRHICNLPVELHQLEDVPPNYTQLGEWAPWKGVKR